MTIFKKDENIKREMKIIKEKWKYQKGTNLPFNSSKSFSSSVIFIPFRYDGEIYSCQRAVPTKSLIMPFRWANLYFVNVPTNAILHVRRQNERNGLIAFTLNKRPGKQSK